MAPLIFLDTSVTKLAVVYAAQYRAVIQSFDWGGQPVSAQLHQSVRRHQHSSLKWRQRSDAARLPFIAQQSCLSRIELGWHRETAWERLGLPRTVGVPPFFNATVRSLDAPIAVERIMVDGSGLCGSPDVLTRRFLESIKHGRFMELRKITGAVPHSSRYVNQLLDAFYLWCAEHNEAYALLTTDYKLKRLVAVSRRRASVPVLTPRDLVSRLFHDRILPQTARISLGLLFTAAMWRSYVRSTVLLPPLS